MSQLCKIKKNIPLGLRNMLNVFLNKIILSMTNIITKTFM